MAAPGTLSAGGGGAGALSVAESYPMSEVRGSGPGCQAATAQEPLRGASKVRGGGWEEQPHVQGVVAVRAQEGLEELLHIQGQEGQR